MRKLKTAHITGYLLSDSRIPRNQDGISREMPELGFGNSLVAVYSEIDEDVAFLVESVQDLPQIEQDAGGETELVAYYEVDSRDLCRWIDDYCSEP